MRASRHRRADAGQALLIVALAAVVMFGFGALALDGGIGQADRRHLQQVSDAAALGGARVSGTVASQNYTAMLYLKQNLTWPALPTGCSSTTTCPNGTYTSGDYTAVISNASSGLDISLTHQRNPVIAGIFGFRATTAIGSHESAGAGSRAVTSQPGAVASAYALAAVGGGVAISGGGTSAPSGDVSGLVYVQTTFGANNTPHAVQMPATVSGTTSGGTAAACSPSTPNRVDTAGTAWSGAPYYSIGGSSNNNNTVPGVASPALFPGLTPTVGAAIYATAAAGRDATTSAYKPGTYQAALPNNAGLLPGVFRITGVSNIDMTGWHNYGSLTVHPDTTTAGTEDTNAAVAIVLDSTDGSSASPGAITWDTLNLNGLDAIAGTDLEGTHNFVFYGETYYGVITINNNAADVVSGIVDLPHASLGASGASAFHFYGSVYVSSVSLSGGGNGAQTFTWVCGLGATSAASGGGGLQR